MLSGNYWWIGPNAFTPSHFSTEADIKFLEELQGLWQVDTSNPTDSVLTGSNTEAYTLAKWWKDMYIPNDAVNTTLPPGYPIDFNPASIVAFPPTAPLPTTNCDPTDPFLLSLANSIPPFPFQRLVGNTTRTFLFMGNRW
jgi:hypothetical protein